MIPQTCAWVENLGRGGQGCIYEAKQYLPFSFNPLPVAVKKFKPLTGISQGRFPPEMNFAKWYNVCKPMGVFFEGATLCTVMRRYSCDLRNEIDSRMKYYRDMRFGYESYDGRPVVPFPDVKGAVFIIVQVAMAMSALHELGIYHKGLKTANILVQKYRLETGDPSMSVHIADFETSEGVVGTGFYRAPEVLQYLNSPNRVSLLKDQWLKADMYSFGMVCYEVLTGGVPFEGRPFSVYGPVLNWERPDLPDYVPEDLKDLIRRCWHGNPDSRPSWTDIIQLLTQAAGYHIDVVDRRRNHFENLASLEWSADTSIESMRTKLKERVHNHLGLRADDSKGFANYLYWVLEFTATLEEYVSKFEVPLSSKNFLVCSLHEATERVKLHDLLELQLLGYVLCLYVSGNQRVKQKQKCSDEYFRQYIEEIQSVMMNVCRSIYKLHSHVTVPKDPVDFSWIDWLLFSRSYIKWQLWTEVRLDKLQKSTMGLILYSVVPRGGGMGTFFLFVCLTTMVLVDSYIFVLALFTSEPILLGIQYGLYRIKGRSNLMYRSSGYRICRLQRAWINYTRYKPLILALIFSLYFLFTRCGWRGVLVWNLFPCLLRFSPYWRRFALKH